MRHLLLRLHAKGTALASASESAAEVVLCLHAGIAIATAIGLGIWTSSVSASLAGGAAAFIALGACLLHRITLWVAAGLGTAALGAIGGATGYLLGTAWARAWLVDVTMVLGSLAGIVLALWCYGRFARALLRTGS